MTDIEKIRLLQATHMLALSQQVIEDMKCIYFDISSALSAKDIAVLTDKLKLYQRFFLEVDKEHKSKKIPLELNIERTLMFWNNKSEEPTYENELRQYYNKTGEVLNRYIS